MWHRIFSISVTGSKFNTWKTIIHLITASNNSQNICSLFTSQIYQPNVKCKDGGSHFYKNQKYKRLEREKKMYFSVISFQ